MMMMMMMMLFFNLKPHGTVAVDGEKSKDCPVQNIAGITLGAIVYHDFHWDLDDHDHDEIGNDDNPDEENPEICNIQLEEERQGFKVKMGLDFKSLSLNIAIVQPA